MLMRGLGFDIKKFNFQTDIKELEIESLDNEEFEFVLGDTSAKLARNSRKQIRRLRYFIVENKQHTPLGTVRIYDVQGTQYTGGSWLMKEKRPNVM